MTRKRNQIGSTLVYFTCSSAKLDSIEAMPSRRGQLCFKELLVGRKIGDHDTQQIVARPRHQIAFQHFGPARDRLAEFRQRLLALALELDRHEHRNRQPDILLIQDRDVA